MLVKMWSVDCEAITGRPWNVEIKSILFSLCVFWEGGVVLFF